MFGLAEVAVEGELHSVDDPTLRSFSALLSLRVDTIRQRLDASPRGQVSRESVELLSPCDGRMEIWAAGVTYLRSRDARMEESVEQSVYDRVYVAERPELFLKSVAWRVVTDGDQVAVRDDSSLNVPEPELALVINSAGEIVAYTVCNDLSSRTIEGENPLYLPQAKIYDASCAIASRIRPAWEVADPYSLAIRARITRDGVTVWDAETSTGALHRKLDDLVTWLFAEQSFPDGVILSTGTGLVPAMDISLLPGDAVAIDIEEVGSLRNEVISRTQVGSSAARAARNRKDTPVVQTTSEPK